MVIELTEEQFKEKIKDFDTGEVKVPGKVLVDFYSSTCGPCKMFGRLLEQFSGNYTDWTFYKVCVDEADDIMEHYRLRSMPTVLTIQEYTESLKAGAMNAEELSGLLAN